MMVRTPRPALVPLLMDLFHRGRIIQLSALDEDQWYRMWKQPQNTGPPCINGIKRLPILQLPLPQDHLPH